MRFVGTGDGTGVRSVRQGTAGWSVGGCMRRRGVISFMRRGKYGVWGCRIPWDGCTVVFGLAVGN